MDEALSKTIEELDLTVRTYNVLKRAEVNTVGELIKMTLWGLANIRNMSTFSMGEIEGKLDNLGWKLRPYNVGVRI